MHNLKTWHGALLFELWICQVRETNDSWWGNNISTAKSLILIISSAAMKITAEVGPSHCFKSQVWHSRQVLTPSLRMSFQIPVSFPFSRLVTRRLNNFSYHLPLFVRPHILNIFPFLCVIFEPLCVKVLSFRRMVPVPLLNEAGIILSVFTET